MSDAPDKESQTEEASEKKLHDSIEKGDTPSSREAAVFASLLATLLYFRVFPALRRRAPDRSALQQILDQCAQFRIGDGRDASALLESACRGRRRLRPARFHSYHPGRSGRFVRPESAAPL